MTLRDEISEALADADKWDRCYPGNIDVESIINELSGALAKAADEIERLERELAETKANVEAFKIAANEAAAKMILMGFPGATVERWEATQDCLEAMQENFAPLSKLVAIERAAVHDSDCAIHNGPALPVGDCDCGAAADEKPTEGDAK